MKASTENIKLIIIEDELHNSRMLHELVSELRPFWQVIQTIGSVKESVCWLKDNPLPDIILMDIQLSDGICFSIFEEVAFPTNCRIIFTTAYDEYAIRAFKVNSIDYLLKPIEKEELEQAFLKFEQLYNEGDSLIPKLFDSSQYMALVDNVLKKKKEYRTRFLVSGINSYHRIDIGEVAYVFSDNKLTFAVDFNGKQHILEYTLEQLETELNPEFFFRANRKVLVNVEAVKKINNDGGGKLKIEIAPQPDFEIPISRLKANDFKLWMGK